MKTFEYDGKTFTRKNTSLALENLWLQFAFTDEGNYNPNCVTDFTRDAAAVNSFMRYMFLGDHEGIDWFEDNSIEGETSSRAVFGETFADFFTSWSEKMIEAQDMLTKSSQEKTSPKSKAKGKATDTA